MRTTVELPDEIRARLLEMAARRGERGFSGLVREALARYLDEEEERRRRAEEARSAIGSLSDESADALEESVRELRENWR
ncbi:MAG: ribbon-helix-helix protein, CopG family [Longimicrobiales bacterium]